jgi:hypothetical protein
MSLEIRIFISVVLIDVLVVSVAIGTGQTLVTNDAHRMMLYQWLNWKGWLASLALAAFCSYQLYQWYFAEMLYGGTWVSLHEHPGSFVLLAVVYSLGALMFLPCPILGVAKLLGIWRITAHENSN